MSSPPSNTSNNCAGHHGADSSEPQSPQRQDRPSIEGMPSETPGDQPEQTVEIRRTTCRDEYENFHIFNKRQDDDDDDDEEARSLIITRNKMIGSALRNFLAALKKSQKFQATRPVKSRLPRISHLIRAVRIPVQVRYSMEDYMNNMNLIALQLERWPVGHFKSFSGQEQRDRGLSFDLQGKQRGCGGNRYMVRLMRSSRGGPGRRGCEVWQHTFVEEPTSGQTQVALGEFLNDARAAKPHRSSA